MNNDAEKALREVLDTDAVPTKPLDEFVAACTEEHPGRWSSLVEWLSAPRRAVAATVAGSFVLTSILVLGILYHSLERTNTRSESPRVLMSMSLMQKGDLENGF